MDEKMRKQINEGTMFHLELMQLARVQQTSLDEIVRDYGYELEAILVKYGLANDRDSH